MPKDALADILGDWEHLLVALDQFLESHQDAFLRRKRDEIAGILAFTKLLASEQLDLAARRQVITKELRIAKQRGRDLAIQARAVLRGHLGHRNVALTLALGAERAKLALPPMEIAGLPLALAAAPIPGATALLSDGEAPTAGPEVPGEGKEAPDALATSPAGVAVSPADS